MSTASTLHIVARIGAEAFAFPGGAVDEVLDAPRIETVPAAPEGMLGQLQHRGRMIGAWDAAWAFGLDSAAGRSRGTALILRDGARRSALVVDDVLDVAHVAAGDRRPVPDGADLDGVLSAVFLAGRAAQGDGGARRGAGRDIPGIICIVRVESLTARFATMTSAVGALAR